MKNKLLIFSIFLSGLLLSCEDFLNKYPHSDVAMDQALQSENDMQVGIYGMYGAFKYASYYGRYFTVYPDVMTDEVAAVNGFSNQLGILYKWIFTATDTDISDMWAIMYSAIARANTIINGIDAIEGDQDHLNYMKGEALMARALAHFDLVRLFAKSYNTSSASADLGVPYMFEFKTGGPPRDNLADVYSYILTDLEDAYDLMVTSSYDDDEVDISTYFSQAAAEALMARVYLYMGDWDNAITYAQKVIDNPNYSLVSGDDFKNMWLNDVGDEIIWKVGLTVNDASDIYPGYNYYNDSQGLPSPDYMPTDNFLSIFDADDIRLQTYFATVTTKHKDDDNNNVILTLCDKYPTNPAFASAPNTNGSNMPKVLRLAEQYLICAEAYAEKGSGSTAWQYIQSLRAARIEGYSPADDAVPSNYKDEIFTERKRELAFEGHLFFDYKRKGLGFTRQGRSEEGNNAYSNDVQDLTVAASNNRWVLPIPQDELNANSGMEGQQNPGY